MRKQIEYVRDFLKSQLNCLPLKTENLFAVRPDRAGTIELIIQIYEIQRPEEAATLIQLGVNHIGSVIVSETEWKDPVLKETLDLIERSDASSSLIPLFTSEASIYRAIDYYRPDIIHFCETLGGRVTVSERCKALVQMQQNVKQRFPEVKIMRSIPIAGPGMADSVSTLELAGIFEPVSDYFLTDTLMTKGSGSLDLQPVEGYIGITGKVCDWDVAADLVKASSIPVILAGGMSPENVFDGIMHVKPAGVDSCTLTNVADKAGPVRFKKDLEKIKRFVREVKRTE